MFYLCHCNVIFTFISSQAVNSGRLQAFDWGNANQNMMHFNQVGNTNAHHSQWCAARSQREQLPLKYLSVYSSASATIGILTAAST